MRAIKIQKSDEIVQVDKWTTNILAEIYPEGARDKRLMFCPEDITLGFLIGKHKYLFKESMSRHPVQFYSEIIAYRFGCLIGVDVPPSFLALRNESGKTICGALIEWFYDYPGTKGDMYFRGGDLAEANIQDFDREKGRQHNIQFILAHCGALDEASKKTQGWGLMHDPYEHWIKTFTFDALIGNQDRHQDNWGILRPPGKAGFSPAFDNGTSLGYELLDDNLSKFDDPQFLEKYIKRGQHHVRWDAEKDQKIHHIELVQHLLEKYPQCRKILENMLNFSREDLYNALGDLKNFDLPIHFSGKRLDFVIKLLLTRKSAIKDAIG